MQEQFPATPAQPQSELAPQQPDGSNDQLQVVTAELSTQLNNTEDINQLLTEPTPAESIDQPIAAASEPTAEKEVKPSFMAKVRGALAKLASKKTVVKAAVVVAAPVAVVAGSQSIEADTPEAPAPVVANVESDSSAALLDPKDTPGSEIVTSTETRIIPQGNTDPGEYTPSPMGNGGSNVYFTPPAMETPPQQPPLVETPSTPEQESDSKSFEAPSVTSPDISNADGGESRNQPPTPQTVESFTRDTPSPESPEYEKVLDPVTNQGSQR